MSLHALCHIDYVILPCNDLMTTRSFYRDILGFRLIDDTTDWVEFDMDGRRLVLRRRGSWLAWNDGPMPKGSAAVQLAFRVRPDEVDDIHQELVAKGHPSSIPRATKRSAIGPASCAIPKAMCWKSSLRSKTKDQLKDLRLARCRAHGRFAMMAPP